MTSYRLTSQARRDLREIVATSIDRFGPMQARRYLQRFEIAFLDLASARRKGRILLDHRPLDIGLLVGVHYVVYRVQGDGRILIVRILHSRMNLPSHLMTP